MRVSVLIPAYNVEPYISECLTSVCNQTYRDLQIIIYDDGSTDGTSEILERFQGNDHRIEVYSRPNRGVSATRNDLLRKIKGDAFIFVDADDWLEPDMIEWLVKSLDSSGCDIAMCGWSRSEEKPRGDYPCEIWDSRTLIRKYLFHKEITGSLYNKLVKTGLLQNNRFNEDISYEEDTLFVWNIIKTVESLVKSDKPLYHYRINTSSLSCRKFGEGKFSASKVWSDICSDADENFSGLSSLAHAQYGHQMAMLLFDAARSHYKADDKTEFLINIVRRNLRHIKKAAFGDRIKLLFAYAVSFSYPLSCLLVRIFYRKKQV